MLVECRDGGSESKDIEGGELDISLECRTVELHCSLVGTETQGINADQISLVLVGELEGIKPRVSLAIKISQIKMDWSIDVNCCDCEFAHVDDRPTGISL